MDHIKFLQQPLVDPIVEIKQYSFELVDEESIEVVFAGDSQTDYFEWVERNRKICERLKK